MNAVVVEARLRSNRRRSALLVAGTIVVLAAIGAAVGAATGAALLGGLAGALLGSAAAWAAYRFGDRLLLSTVGARAVGPDDEPRLHNIAEGLATAGDLPKPALYVVEEESPNAFAAGCDPRRAWIVVTRGLLARLNRIELEGVIAHEMVHIRDGDALLGTLVATLVAGPVLLAEPLLGRLWARQGAAAGGSSRGQRSPLLAALGVVLALPAPLLAQAVRLAVPQDRESRADEEGALLARYPPGLTAALRKIGADPHPLPTATAATAHLWLRQPSRLPGGEPHWFERMFTTHPPIEDRIRVLQEL